MLGTALLGRLLVISVIVEDVRLHPTLVTSHQNASKPRQVPSEAFLSEDAKEKLKAEEWLFNAKCKPKTSVCRQRTPDAVLQCFGANVNYSYTSHVEISGDLEDYSSVRLLPRCWPHLRKLLCYASFTPCENDGTLAVIYAVPSTLCKLAKDECRFLVEMGSYPPALIDCFTGLFVAADCPESKREPNKTLRWTDTDDACVAPLVKSSVSPHVIDECAMNCTSPFLTEVDHARVSHARNISLFVAISVSLFTVIALGLKLVFWKQTSLSKSCSTREECGISLALALLLLAFCVAWRIHPRCRSDGSSPSYHSKESFFNEVWWCAVQFFIVYSTALSASLLFVLLVWLKCSLCSVGTPMGKASTARREKRSTSSVYCTYLVVFLISSGLPLCLIAFYKEIGSDGISGVCFPAHMNAPSLFFVVYFVPSAVLLVSFALVLFGRRREDVREEIPLSPLAQNSQVPNASEREGEREKWQAANASRLLRLCILLTLLSVIVITSAVLEFGVFPSAASKDASLRAYVNCSLFSNNNVGCSHLLVQFDVRFVFARLLLPLAVVLTVCGKACWTEETGSAWGLVFASAKRCFSPSMKMGTNENANQGDTEAVESLLPPDADNRTRSASRRRRTSPSATAADTLLAPSGTESEPDAAADRRYRAAKRRSSTHLHDLKDRFKRASFVSLMSRQSSRQTGSVSLPMPSNFTSSADLGFPDLSKHPVLDAKTYYEQQQQRSFWLGYLFCVSQQPFQAAAAAAVASALSPPAGSRGDADTVVPNEQRQATVAGGSATPLAPDGAPWMAAPSMWPPLLSYLAAGLYGPGSAGATQPHQVEQGTTARRPRSAPVDCATASGAGCGRVPAGRKGETATTAKCSDPPEIADDDEDDAESDASSSVDADEKLVEELIERYGSSSVQVRNFIASIVEHERATSTAGQASSTMEGEQAVSDAEEATTTKSRVPSSLSYRPTMPTAQQPGNDRIGEQRTV